MTPPVLNRCPCGQIKRADRDRCCCRCEGGAHNVACAIRQLSAEDVPALQLLAS
jgi:hypothetical protein